MVVVEGDYQIPTCSACGLEVDEAGHTIWTRAPGGEPHLQVIKLVHRAPGYESGQGEDLDDAEPEDPGPDTPRMCNGAEFLGPR